MTNTDNSKYIPVTKTGLACTLGMYALAGELFLTKLIAGKEAQDIKEQMKRQERLITHYSMLSFGETEKLNPSIYFTPLPTDEVWEFATESKKGPSLTFRAGYALMRDGVMICEIVIAMG